MLKHKFDNRYKIIEFKFLIFNLLMILTLFLGIITDNVFSDFFLLFVNFSIRRSFNIFFQQLVKNFVKST